MVSSGESQWLGLYENEGFALESIAKNFRKSCTERTLGTVFSTKEIELEWFSSSTSITLLVAWISKSKIYAREGSAIKLTNTKIIIKLYIFCIFICTKIQVQIYNREKFLPREL